VQRVRGDRPVAAVSRSFAFCLLAQSKHNMPRAEEVVHIFRGFKDFIDVFAAQKKRGKPGVSWQFSLYTARTIPYDANERPQENLLSGSLYTGKNRTKFRKYKGDTWQS
jgi:hypothetical protein